MTSSKRYMYKCKKCKYPCYVIVEGDDGVPDCCLFGSYEKSDFYHIDPVEIKEMFVCYREDIDIPKGYLKNG